MTKKSKQQAPEIDELALKGWTAADVNELDFIVNQRDDIAKREKVLESTKAEMNQRVTNLLLMHGEEGVRHPRGSLTIQSMSRETINRDQLNRALAKRGVAVQTIVEAVTEATRVNTFTTVVFRPVKEVDG